MIAQWLTKNNRSGANAPVYRYRFNHLPHDTDASNITSGIATGVEQRYVFSNLVPDHPWDRALAYELSTAWVSFVHGLDPNSGAGQFFLSLFHSCVALAKGFVLMGLCEQIVRFRNGLCMGQMVRAWCLVDMGRVLRKIHIGARQLTTL